MQDRLSRLIADRTRVLSALGHDLRSPLTAMRVRVELVEDEETRDTLIADIEEMQEMVDASLEKVSHLLGHSSLHQTQKYAKFAQRPTADEARLILDKRA